MFAKRKIGPLAAALCIALAASADAGAADPSLADAEQAFWVCDYVATTRGLDATPVDVCSEVTNMVLAEKFDGDFGRMLSWWRQNKPAEHGRLQAASLNAR